jgi:lysophospholipase L1-like esterase
VTEVTLVAHGDSITDDQGTDNYTRVLKGLLEADGTRSVTLVQRGVNGISWNYDWPIDPNTDTMMTEADTEIDPHASADAILVLFAGTNGLMLGPHSAATEYADFETYLDDRIDAGWNVENIYVVAMLPREGFTDAIRVDYNAMLEQGSLTYGYKLVTPDYHPSLDDHADTNFFYDGTHLTPAGHSALADEIYAVITEPVPPIQWQAYGNGLGVVPEGYPRLLATRVNTSGAGRSVRSSTSQFSGKRYVELLLEEVGTQGGCIIGVAGAAFDPDGVVGYDAGGDSIGYTGTYGNLIQSSAPTGVDYPGGPFANGDTVGVLIDFTAETVQFNLNGGAWSNTVSTTSLGDDIYIAVGLTHTPYSRVKLNDVLTYALPSGATEWDYEAPPVNTVAPAISGTEAEGETLTCSTGTWTGTPAPTYAYQWYRAITSGGSIVTSGGLFTGVAISGATASTYELVTDDVGELLYCEVTATNASGSAMEQSNATDAIEGWYGGLAYADMAVVADFNNNRYAITEVELGDIATATAAELKVKREATFDEVFAYTAASDAERSYTDDGGVLRQMDYGRTNRQLYSQDLTHASWEKDDATITADATLAPNGTMTADKIVEAATAGEHSVYMTSGGEITLWKPYTLSFYAKAAERNIIRVYVAQWNNFVVFVNLLDGTTSGQADGNDPSVSVSADENGFYRIKVTDVSGVANARPYINLVSSGTTVSYVGDGTSGAYLWGFQLEPGIEAGEYIPTTSTAVQNGVNAPRLTYANDKQQLRLENEGTNLQPRSQEFNTGWIPSAATVSANAAVSPDGTTTADKLVEDTTAADHYVYNTNVVPTAAVHTASIYVKAAGRNYARVSFTIGGFALGGWVFINLTTGALSAVTHAGGATGFTATSTDAGNGWWRVTLTGTATVTEWYIIAAPSTDGTTTNHLGDGASGIYLWGAQVELGPSATDYIPTAGAAVTRAVETARFSPLVEAIFGRAAGTVVVRCDLDNIALHSRIVGYDGIRSLINGYGEQPLLMQGYNQAESFQTTLDSGSWADPLGAAAAWDAAGSALCANGGAVATATQQVTPRTKLYLARDENIGSGAYGAGYYDFVGIAPERLADATLQALAVPA